METAVDTPRSTRNQENVNARAFAAGTGVTVALVAAAILAFASVAAYVAFDGMPFGSDDSADATVSLDSGAPQAAALAASRTADAVAADPTELSAAALAEIRAALPPGATNGGGSGNNAIAGGSDSGPATGGTDPAARGTLGGTVGAAEDTAGGLGPDLPLSDATGPITAPVDDAVNGALNDVGNGVGAGNLGDQVNGTVNGLLP